MANELGAEKQLIYPPKSSGNKMTTQLAYLSTYDAIIDKDYAFVVYKEEDTKKGEWKLKVKSRETAGTSIDPMHPIFRRKMTEAAKSGGEYFVMGFGISPRDGDPRLIESRIYFNELLQPQYYQLHVVTRNVDGTPGEEKHIRVEWPE